MSGRGRQKQMPGPAPQRQVVPPPPQMQQRQVPLPPQMQQRQVLSPPQMQEKPEKQSNQKLTIGQAIGLTTIRLGRVEQFIQQLQTDGIEMNSVQQPELLDTGLIQNIVSRLNTIEQTDTEERMKAMENDLKDTKNLLLKLMLKFENFSDDTLAKFDNHQQQITFNLEQLQQEEVHDEIQDALNQDQPQEEQEQQAVPSNESEAVPVPVP